MEAAEGRFGRSWGFCCFRRSITQDLRENNLVDGGLGERLPMLLCPFLIFPRVVAGETIVLFNDLGKLWAFRAALLALAFSQRMAILHTVPASLNVGIRARQGTLPRARLASATRAAASRAAASRAKLLMGSTYKVQLVSNWVGMLLTVFIRACLA